MAPDRLLSRPRVRIHLAPPPSRYLWRNLARITEKPATASGQIVDQGVVVTMGLEGQRRHRRDCRGRTWCCRLRAELQE